MNIFELMREYFFGYNSFFYWRNALELLFFFAIIYYFSLWLKRDRQKNLLPYFYVYCFLTLCSHTVQLTTISYFLFLFAPVALMLFALVHQEILQRNFVALNNIVPVTHIQSQWPEALIRSCLVTINNNKKVYCVIEKKDSLQDFIEAQLTLHANLDQTLFKILQESNIFDEKKMVWLNTHGKLIGINASCKKNILQDLTNMDEKNITTWKQNALLLSIKTDALFFRITPYKRTFDIIFNGKVIDNVKANNALNIIKKYALSQFFIKEVSLAKGEYIHEANSKKNILKQRTD